MTRRHGYVRGAVVTLWSPEDERVMLIKRVIGLPGDWVRVPTERNTHRLQHVPPGQVWVEGDGTCSRDSTSFGPVPLALLTGQVAAVIWPPWRAQTLTAGLPAARGQPTCIGSDKDFDCAWRKLAVDFTVARLGVRRQLHALLTKFLPAA